MGGLVGHACTGSPEGPRCARTWNHARKSGFGSNAQSGPSRGRFSTPAADPAAGFFVIWRFDRHEAANSNLCDWLVACVCLTGFLVLFCRGGRFVCPFVCPIHVPINEVTCRLRVPLRMSHMRLVCPIRVPLRAPYVSLTCPLRVPLRGPRVPCMCPPAVGACPIRMPLLLKTRLGSMVTTERASFDKETAGFIGNWWGQKDSVAAGGYQGRVEENVAKWDGGH